MFEELSEKLDGVLGRWRQRGLLTEAQVREGLREVRRVLLEADVNYQLARDFLTRVEEKAVAEKVLKSVAPGQQIVKIVHDELISLLGENPEPLKVAAVGPTVILLAGLQGSGKTTTAAKLASGWPARVVSRCWRRSMCTGRRPSTSWRRWVSR